MPSSSSSLWRFSITIGTIQSANSTTAIIIVYEQTGVVDKVIGLVAEDSVSSAFFYKYFSPSFEIRELPMEQMMRFCRSLPTSFFLHGDTLTQAYEGLAINPVLLLGE